MFLPKDTYWHSALPIDHISSFRRWELTETHTGQHTENERFWNSLFYRGSLHQTSLSRTVQKRRKDFKRQTGWKTPMKQCLPGTYELTETVAACTETSRVQIQIY